MHGHTSNQDRYHQTCQLQAATVANGYKDDGFSAFLVVCLVRNTVAVRRLPLLIVDVNAMFVWGF